MTILPSLDDREKAVLKLMKSLEIETQKNTNILSSPTKRKAEAGRRYPQQIDRSVLEYILRPPDGRSFDFFDRQAEDLRAQLAKTDEELKSSRTGPG